MYIEFKAFICFFYYIKISYLVFINFSTLQFGFALFLKRDDDQGHENVNEEEWKHYEVHYVENGHFYSKILDGSLVAIRSCHGVL